MENLDSLFDIPVDVLFGGEKGERGERGLKGDKGDKGEPGADGRDGINGKDGQPGKGGANGKNGKDGKNGADGKDGRDGIDGLDGKSAYEIWLEQGNKGTEEDFLKSLKGKDGKQSTWHGNAFTNVNELTKPYKQVDDDYIAGRGDYFIDITEAGKTVYLTSEFDKGHMLYIDNASTGYIYINGLYGSTIIFTTPCETALVVWSGSEWRVK